MNYLKIAWRNLVNRKFYTVLNVSGLVMGMVCCIFIYLYADYHLSFDTYHPKAKTTFRLVYELRLDKTEYDKGASYAMFNALRTQMPQVSSSAIAISNQSFIVDVNGDSKRRFREEKNISFANSDWFKLFSYHWLKGEPGQLDQLNTVALTAKQAAKYFGGGNPMGQWLQLSGKRLKVIGLIDDAHNTDLKADMYVSLSSYKNLNPGLEDSFFTSWGYQMNTNNAFVALNDVSKKEQIEQQLLKLSAQTELGPDVAKYFSFKLLPLAQQHFDARYGGPVQKSNLTILGLIGLLILLIASINYINLVIAQQMRRSQEIATRKVLGASVKQLFTQFMAESFLTTVIALAVALFLALLLLPTANQFLFADEPLYIRSYNNLALFGLVMLVALTLITGVYPAMVLSRVNIFQLLKKQSAALSAGLGRKALVVMQNVVTQLLIICTLIIVMQVNLLKNTDTGFDRKLVISVPVGQLTLGQKARFATDLKSIPGISSFTLCHKPPSSDSRVGATVQYNDNPKSESWPARFAIGDSAYCRTFGLHIIAGNNIRPGRKTPEFLINETMARRLRTETGADVIGKHLTAGDFKGVITGIVKDFNVRTLAEPIEPSVVLEDEYFQTNLAIKLSGGNTAATIDAIQKTYTRILPDQLFTYQFVDQQIAALYKSETLQEKLIWTSATVAIVISCLGLLGLVSIITLQRTKEIGIRKVLGATVPQIVSLLSADFMRLILLALVISSPIAWFALNNWLQNFAYHIQIQWWIFASAGLLSVLIALITISFQSVNVATANPVNSLRSE